MLIRWKGYEYLGFMIPIGMWAMVAIFLRPDYWVAVRISLAIAAVLVWVVGSRLNAEGKDEHGDALHQTFGFPMQWSGLALCIFGFVLTL